MSQHFSDTPGYGSYSSMDTELIVTGNSVGGEQFRFKPLRSTLILVLFQLVLVTIYYLCLYIPIDEDPSDYNYIIFAYIFIWVGIAILYLILKHFHQKERAKGYLVLYQQTQTLLLIPFVVWAVGIAFIALLFCELPVGQKSKYLNLRPINFLQIFIAPELLIIFVCSCIYFMIVYRHNNRRSQPDVMESLNLSTIQSQDKIMEQQAEQIRYLQEARKKLGKLVVDLNARLEQSSRHPDQGNLAYELAKKDEEIRLLTNKCNKLEYQANEYSHDGDLFKEKAFQLQKAIEENKSLQLQLEINKQELGKIQLLYEMEKNTVVELQNKYDDIALEYEKLSGKPILDQTIYDKSLK